MTQLDYMSVLPASTTPRNGKLQCCRTCCAGCAGIEVAEALSEGLDTAWDVENGDYRKVLDAGPVTANMRGTLNLMVQSKPLRGRWPRNEQPPRSSCGVSRDPGRLIRAQRQVGRGGCSHIERQL